MSGISVCIAVEKNLLVESRGTRTWNLQHPSHTLYQLSYLKPAAHGRQKTENRKHVFHLFRVFGPPCADDKNRKRLFHETNMFVSRNKHVCFVKQTCLFRETSVLQNNCFGLPCAVFVFCFLFSVFVIRTRTPENTKHVFCFLFFAVRVRRALLLLQMLATLQMLFYQQVEIS